MVYGGINGFVVVFTVWPMMDKLWRKIDAPRRLLPAMVQFGAGTAANGGPGSPNTLNLVVTRTMDVAPSAGFGMGMIYRFRIIPLRGSGIIKKSTCPPIPSGTGAYMNDNYIHNDARKE